MPSRKCIRCDCWHNMCVTYDGDETRNQELDLCRHCTFSGFRIEHITEKIVIDPGHERVHTHHGAALIKKSFDDKDN